jgi:nicotinamidase/pyrazinamidase
MPAERPAERDRAALLVVDVQPDFLPGGPLGIAGGDAILDGIAALMRSTRFRLQVATQDWHPPGHVSFASTHDGRTPMEVIDLYGHEQTLWPDHCVQGTPGAALREGLPWERLAAIIRKGTDPSSDSYSAFRNNWDEAGERPTTGLAGYLRERGVEKVFICGLARDFCVRWSARDAAQEGFHVTVLWDLSRPVDAASDAEVREELEGLGVRIISSEDLGRG